MTKTTIKWKPELYNEKHAFVYNYGEHLIQLLDPKADDRILDLGCGSGQLTSKINEIATEVIGMDKSEDMIADAKSKFPNITFKVGDASNFSFDKKFDAIFSNATLHWVTDYKQAIQCMYNNLKSGGKIVVEFGGQGNVETIVDQLRLSLKNKGYLEQSNIEQWYFPTIGAYTTALEAVGFRVLFAEHYDRPTELADENSGIKDWLTMFGAAFFNGVSEQDKEAIKTEVQDSIKEKCLIDEKWYADYKRIRVIAKK